MYRELNWCPWQKESFIYFFIFCKYQLSALLAISFIHVSFAQEWTKVIFVKYVVYLQIEKVGKDCISSQNSNGDRLSLYSLFQFPLNSVMVRVPDSEHSKFLIQFYPAVVALYILFSFVT